MHRGVIYGVIAFGLVVGLVAFVCAVKSGWSLPLAAKVLAVLVFALVVHPLKSVAFKSKSRGDRRDTIGIALLVFAVLVAAGGVIVGVVGRGPWFEAAAGLLAIAVVVATAGVLALRGRRKAPDSMGWHP